MLRKAGMVFMLVLFLPLIGTGCWSRHELNDLAITVAIGIDKAGDRYKLSAQIVNPGEVVAKKVSSKGAPVVTYSETGTTIPEALRIMTSKSPRKLYFSHLRMLVVSEQLAKEGLGRTLDFFSRDHEFRTDFYIAVAKGVPAEKILEVYTVPQEIIPANKMFKSLDTSSKLWAATGKLTIDELMNDMISEGKQPVVTGVGLTDDYESKETETEENVRNIKPISSLDFRGLAVFRKDKLIGWLNKDESKAYNYIRGKVKSTIGYVTCPDGGKLAVEVIRTKSKVQGKVANGKPSVMVHLEMESNVADVECKIDLKDPNTIHELEANAEKRVKRFMDQTIDKAQHDYHSDIFGFGEAIHRSAPKQWKQMKSSWDEEFADLHVDASVVVKIRRIGTVTDSFLEKLKE